MQKICVFILASSLFLLGSCQKEEPVVEQETDVSTQTSTDNQNAEQVIQKALDEMEDPEQKEAFLEALDVIGSNNEVEVVTETQVDLPDPSTLPTSWGGSAPESIPLSDEEVEMTQEEIDALIEELLSELVSGIE